MSEQLKVTGLPKRQAEALLLTASGMTRKEAARKMACSPANVVMLMDTVRFKLHAKTAAEAVSVAFQRGILRLMALVMFVSAISPAFPTPAQADEQDRDPFMRRGRSTRRGVRRHRLRGRANDNQFDIDFINSTGLQPVLVWDDGLFVTYLPGDKQ
jgi:DNA-binding CsgD family transcriptional regulator